MNAEQIYIGIGRLIEAPPVDRPAQDVQKWVGMAQAYAEEMRDPLSAGIIQTFASKIYMGTSSANNFVVHKVLGVLYKLLATAEFKAPAPSQGAFIPAGNTFDAMNAVGKVLSDARQSVLIVDPYMDEKALTDFAPLANESVAVRLLADSGAVKPTLLPAVVRWRQQYAGSRPLEARVTHQPKLLHDRTIIVDEQTVWILTQSLNAFAARSPATIVRVEGDAVRLKLDAYSDFWINGLNLA